MTIDNFKLLEENFLQFIEGDFYFVQILQRKKENPTLKKNGQVIKTYFIKNREQYLACQEEIKTLCEVFNARAYIGVNRRNFKKLAFHVLEATTELLINEQYTAVTHVYESVCGEYIVGDKIWIVDIDSYDATLLEKTKVAIEKCTSGFKPIVVLTVPTINGVHLLTHPFNLAEFSKIPVVSQVDIHKNNPTLLYHKQS